MVIKVTYYTAADARYFIGVVMLVNSLALTSNTEELVVLDLGLTKQQRNLLTGLATSVHIPGALKPRLPYCVKPLVQVMRETDVAVWIDSDMMVTRPLAPLVDRAAAGAICMFPDPEGERWFPEWQEEFELQAPLRREQYVNAGFFALSTRRWGKLLDRYWELCQRLEPERMIGHGGRKNDPIWAGDQDALNALLMSEVPAGAIEVQGEGDEVYCHVPGDIHVHDGRTLEVHKEGQPVTLIHHALGPKPWAADGWKKFQQNVYVKLAPRVLFGDDVPLRLDPQLVPPRLRLGPWAWVARRLAGMRGRGYWFAYSVYYGLPAPVRRRVKAAVRDT